MNKFFILGVMFVFLLPSTCAFSFEEFISDFFSFTGMSVLEVNQIKKEDTNKFEKISIPETKKVEAIPEDFGNSVEHLEKINSELEKEKKAEKSSSKKNKIKKIIPECSDFLDNNVNYLKKGTCKDNTRRLLKKYTSEDYCSTDGITLMEHFCNSENKCEGSWYVCPNGCENGACLTEKKGDFIPDLKVLSVSNGVIGATVLVKNKGTMGTYFKTKLNLNDVQSISKIDYYLEPGETISVELEDYIIGNYSLEILVDEDLNELDNLFKGEIYDNSENKFQNLSDEKITGKTISKIEEKEIEIGESNFIKLLNFLRRFF